MKMERSAKIFFLILLLLPLIAVGCGGGGNQNNANTANANASPTSSLPKDAKPMGQAAPGFFMAGPEGDVTLSVIAPADGKVLPGDAISPTFNISGYPIYKDADRDKGQHIHVILDNEPYEADYNPNLPFKPAGGKFEALKEGTHTLRAFPSREWHESIKQENGADFTFITFHVNKETPGLKIDKSKPLLTYSRPKGEYKWKDDPRGVMLDFYVTNAKLNPKEYKIKYSVNGGREQILTKWEPIWIKWEELPPSEYSVDLQLLDANNKPVPFMVGNVDYNHTVRKFTVLPQGATTAGH